MIKFFKFNENGFSLPQAIISLAITAVIALAVMRLGQNATKVNKTAELREEMRAEMAVISRNLSSRAACSSVFGGLPLPVPVAGQSTPPLYEFNGTQQTIQINDEDEDGNPVSVGTVVIGGEYFKNRYILQSLTIEGDANNPTIMKIIFQYNRINENNELNKALQFKSIAMAKVSLNSTTGNIDNCYTLNTQGLRSIGETEDLVSMDQALNNICNGLGTFVDIPNGVCTIYGVATYGCPSSAPYLVRYSLDPDQGDYIPVCSEYPTGEQWSANMTRHYWDNINSFRCGDNQIQRGINARGFAICVDVPNCGSLQLLKMVGDEFTCVPIPVQETSEFSQITSGDYCGITTTGGKLNLHCDECNPEATDPTCNSLRADVCQFELVTEPDGCGLLCGMGTKDCCRSESRHGQSCTSDSDCGLAGACQQNGGTCNSISLPPMGYDRSCEMILNANDCVAENPRCEWREVGSVWECRSEMILCSQLPGNTCEYTPHYAQFPSNCEWNPGPWECNCP